VQKERGKAKERRAMRRGESGRRMGDRGVAGLHITWLTGEWEERGRKKGGGEGGEEGQRGERMCGETERWGGGQEALEGREIGSSEVKDCKMKLRAGNEGCGGCEQGEKREKGLRQIWAGR